MAINLYHVTDPEAYQAAGPTDLIELLPVPGCNPLFLPKWILEVLVYGIMHYEFIHLSGPTGTAKNSVIEALHLVPENLRGICRGLNFPFREIKVYPIEMATFEAPGELYERRALRNGATYDEESRLVIALKDSIKHKEHFLPLIWLREIGRVHSPIVQGGLLNLMTKSDIVLPDNTRIDGKCISWIADSNYQADSDSTHTLVTLDDALKRRFSINLTLDYLTAEQEGTVLSQIFHSEIQGEMGNA